MATEEMFDDPNAKLEYQARVQLGLGDSWKLDTMASAIQVGVEEQIERLESDNELTDEERWQELDMNGTPLARLPKGLILVTMINQKDGETETKAGFVQTR